MGYKPYYANQKTFKSKLVSKRDKLRLHRTIRPVITYASETNMGTKGIYKTKIINK